MLLQVQKKIFTMLTLFILMPLFSPTLNSLIAQAQEFDADHLGSFFFPTASPGLQNSCPQSPMRDVNSNYLVSTSSYADISQMFRELPLGNHSGNNQCYMRAYVWGYQLWRQHGLYSLKAIVFFNNVNARKNRHSWWFHVAPVLVDHSRNAWVIDPQYKSGPSTLSNWAETFMVKGTRCPVINNMKIYQQYKNKFDCMIRIVPMYYTGTVDVETADRNQRSRSWSWNRNNLYEAKLHFAPQVRNRIAVDRL